METIFVIKSLQKGTWYYLTTILFDHSRLWNVDIYISHKFKTYQEAEEALNRGAKEHYWGGFYQIEKYFVAR